MGGRTTHDDEAWTPVTGPRGRAPVLGELRDLTGRRIRYASSAGTRTAEGLEPVRAPSLLPYIGKRRFRVSPMSDNVSRGQSAEGDDTRAPFTYRRQFYRLYALVKSSR